MKPAVVGVQVFTVLAEKSITVVGGADDELELTGTTIFTRGRSGVHFDIEAEYEPDHNIRNGLDGFEYLGSHHCLCECFACRLNANAGANI